MRKLAARILNMPTLKSNQRCPIPGHGWKCACRGEVQELKYHFVNHGKWETVRTGVRRIRDEHADHPDGYRYKLSPAEMRKVLDRKIEEQQGICAVCKEPMTDYSDIMPDHEKPKGLGGSRADDRPENIRATHSKCNMKKGSKRI